MRKISELLCVLTLTFGTLAGVAAAQEKTVRYVPRTTSGSPIPKGSIKMAGPDNHALVALKAQNHLTSALNLKLYKEKTGLGGTPKDPGIKNGTVDTLPYFLSWFNTGTRNSIYTYAMVGQSPSAGGTTGINNQVIPLISVLEVGGVPVYVFDPTIANDPQGAASVPSAGPGTDTGLVSQSPLYDATTTYPGNGGSLPPDTGQVLDTAQRAEFTGVRTADWHTPLNAPMSSGIIWIQFLEFNNGDWACLRGSGPPCDTSIHDFPVVNINVISNNFAFILTVESPANSTVPIIVTDFVTAFQNGVPAQCCVLGFHTAQAGIVDPAGILVWTWATYIPHSLDNGFGNPFAGGFGYDTMVLSHELSELYNDPFVNTSVSPWVDGSVSFAQGNLETGDTIEGMAAADVIYNVPLTTTGGPYTYNLQNIALLQWFTRTPLASPGGGIYSWPNTNTLNQCAHVSSPVVNWCYGEGSAGFFFGPPY